MIYAIYHQYGMSLVEARTAQHAMNKARRYFGEYGGPYRLAQDQEQALVWGRAMGAATI